MRTLWHKQATELQLLGVVESPIREGLVNLLVCLREEILNALLRCPAERIVICESNLPSEDIPIYGGVL